MLVFANQMYGAVVGNGFKPFRYDGIFTNYSKRELY